MSKAEFIYGAVYLITSLIDGKKYVGQTTRPLELRWREHCSSKTCRRLANAISKHGKQNFKIEMLCSAFSKEDLDQKEQFFIELHSTSAPHGYNLREGGSRGKNSEETKKKIAESVSNYVRTEQHRKNLSDSQRGKIIPNAVKEKIRSKLLGVKLTAQHRANISAGQSGEKHWSKKKGLTEEQKNKLLVNLSKRPRNHTEETKRKISANGVGMRGKRHSPETIEKMRLAKIGKKLSDQAKVNMSLAQRQRRENEFQS